MSDDALPNLLVPGVTKAGTTSLYGYLCQHPDIHGGDMKEINHFGSLKDGVDPPPLAALAAHFRGAGPSRYRLDVSPQYFHGGQVLVDAVAEALPDARVLIMMRDPVPRLFSAFGMQRFKGNLPADLTYADYLDRCLRVAEHGVQVAEDRRYRALAVADYSAHLPLWLEAFPDATRVVFFEHLKADASQVVARIFGWLGLQERLEDGLDARARNATIQHRNGAVAVVAQTVNRIVGPTLERHPAVKHKIRAVYGRLNGTPTATEVVHDPESRARVAAYYAPVVSRLRPLLSPEVTGGVDLPDWLRVDG